MTKKQKIDLLIKIMTVFNNSALTASFTLAASIIPTGTICSALVYIFIGIILATTFRKTQNFMLTMFLWLPAMSFHRITCWISK